MVVTLNKKSYNKTFSSSSIIIMIETPQEGIVLFYNEFSESSNSFWTPYGTERYCHSISSAS